MTDKRSTRRRFLKTTGSVALLGLGDLRFLAHLRPVSAQEARLDPQVVRLRPEIEPLVRLLEETPRKRLLEEVATRIHRGLSYRELLAALLLAGVRNVQPRPHVGYKFHAVLVVNSAHLASLSSPASDRWLPIFWALDYFKSSQAQDVHEGDWTMSPVDESAVPPPHKARHMFQQAMQSWDEPAADAAVAALARSAGAQEVFEMFFRFGARDFRSIGHKAIFVANSYRTLQCIGWHHSEPVLRSLAYALLNHVGEPNPATSDLAPDRAWRRNQELVRDIRTDWSDGRVEPSATAEMLDVLREGSDENASRKVVELLGRGIAPQSVWDALFDGAAELVLRQPGIVSLHAATTTNAMYFAYQTTGSDETRRLLMLQNAAFLPMFREEMHERGMVRDLRIDEFPPASDPSQERERPAPTTGHLEAIEGIFAELGRDRLTAAGKALAFLQSEGHAKDLIDTARRLVFLKGNDAHDYKYSSAVLEDFYHVNPAWRDRFLAASTLLLPSSADPDNTLVQRTRAALQG